MFQKYPFAQDDKGSSINWFVILICQFGALKARGADTRYPGGCYYFTLL